jgi:hypothetical protein
MNALRSATVLTVTGELFTSSSKRRVQALYVLLSAAASSAWPYFSAALRVLKAVSPCDRTGPPRIARQPPALKPERSRGSWA